MRVFLQIAVAMAANLTAPEPPSSWGWFLWGVTEPEATEADTTPPEDSGVASRPVLEALWEWLQSLYPIDPEAESDLSPGTKNPKGRPGRTEGPNHWFFAFWINLLVWVADTGFVYCGTLCTSVGYAAKWWWGLFASSLPSGRSPGWSSRS